MHAFITTLYPCIQMQIRTCIYMHAHSAPISVVQIMYRSGPGNTKRDMDPGWPRRAKCKTVFNNQASIDDADHLWMKEFVKVSKVQKLFHRSFEPMLSAFQAKLSISQCYQFPATVSRIHPWTYLGGSGFKSQQINPALWERPKNA